MKNRMKFISAAMVLTLAGTALVGCDMSGTSGQTAKEKKVMNVALNPEVEFVLNGEDKVVSVNALNEEGNLIISAEAFSNVEGKSAEEAAKLFVQVSKDTGFLIEGNVKAGENEIKIALSGDTEQAEKLYNEVKSEVETYLSSVDVQATLAQAQAITQQELQKLVEECAPYVDAAQMEYAELLDALEQSRKETAEFYSQELKNAYYEAKAFAMEQAKLETLKTHMNSMQTLAFDVLCSSYTLAIDTIESARMTFLVNENSIYQVALKNFREAKTDFLNYRNYVASLPEAEVTKEQADRLAAYETALNKMETALVNAGTQANAGLDNAKAMVKQAHDAILEKLNEWSVNANAHVEEIATKQQEAQTAFFTKFESDYAAAKAKAQENWNAMQAELEKGEVSEK